MALARFSPGCDVYVFECVTEWEHQIPQLTCCGCMLGDERLNFWTDNTQEMHDHLLAHREAGFDIPEWLLENVLDYPLGEEL